MTKFAAYDDIAIYAIANSPAEAISQARLDARAPNAVFSTAPIRDKLAEQIERFGWNAYLESFSIDKRGFIVRD